MLNLFGAIGCKTSAVMALAICPLLLSAASGAAFGQSAPPTQSAASVQAAAPAQAAPTEPPPAPGHVNIRVINALTNKPIHDERLNVAFREDQIGSVAMATDKNGIILVDTKKAATLRILANMYADCRPRSELYTNYSVATILSSGITTGNLCSSASPVAKPGELILYEIPKTYVRQYPAQPADSLPHSPK